MIPDVIAGTFLVHDIYAKVLFDMVKTKVYKYYILPSNQLTFN